MMLDQKLWRQKFQDKMSCVGKITRLLLNRNVSWWWPTWGGGGGYICTLCVLHQSQYHFLQRKQCYKLKEYTGSAQHIFNDWALFYVPNSQSFFSHCAFGLLQQKSHFCFDDKFQSKWPAIVKVLPYGCFLTISWDSILQWTPLFPSLCLHHVGKTPTFYTSVFNAVYEIYRVGLKNNPKIT